jgi:hypothetical protein
MKLSWNSKTKEKMRTWWQYRYPAPGRKCRSEKRVICIFSDLNSGTLDILKPLSKSFCRFFKTPDVMASHFSATSSLEFSSQSSIGLL